MQPPVSIATGAVGLDDRQVWPFVGLQYLLPGSEPDHLVRITGVHQTRPPPSPELAIWLSTMAPPQPAQFTLIWANTTAKSSFTFRFPSAVHIEDRRPGRFCTCLIHPMSPHCSTDSLHT